jgi:hypothetical protein
MAGVFGLDAALFRTPLYPSIVEPDSSTGIFELILQRERHRQAANGDNLVATLGDSRLAYAPRLSNAISAETGLVFGNAGAAGSNPMTWYYMLRDLDPTARRYRAIVIATDEYGDEDQDAEPDEDIRPLHYVVNRLRLGDTLAFARAFHGLPLEFEALRGALLKGIVYQSDILAYLPHRKQRREKVRQYRQWFDVWTDNYVETAASMAGLRIDWQSMTATFGPEATEPQRDTVNSVLLHKPAPQTGRLAAFRRKWYGRIVDRYRGSPTKVIFIRLARGPIPRPDSLSRAQTSVVREMSSRPGVLVSPEHTFDYLERPELYKDGLHLNCEGIALFSPALAREVSRMLAAAK